MRKRQKVLSFLVHLVFISTMPRSKYVRISFGRLRWRHRRQQQPEIRWNRVKRKCEYYSGSHKQCYTHNAASRTVRVRSKVSLIFVPSSAVIENRPSFALFHFITL